MTADIFITFFVLGFMFLFLILNYISVEVVILGALMVLLWGGILTLDEAFAGFINEGVITIASLFIMMHMVQKHPLFPKLTRFIFGNKQTLLSGMTRMMTVTASCSSLMNNTPLVVLFTPIVKRWSNLHSIFPSKLLIPLSYAAILGGMCTLIGTSTNLVVHTLLQKNGFDGFSIFELAFVGVPLFFFALLYMVVIGKKLLPNIQSDPKDVSMNSQLIEVQVNEDFQWVGQTIKEAGLRELKQSYIMAILRQGECLFPVSPNQKIQMFDQLIFVGDTTCYKEIETIPGLSLGETKCEFITHESELSWVEAVVPQHSSLVSQRIRNLNFRSRFGGVIVGVYRNGKRINEKIGSIRIKSGDMLYILTSKDLSQFQSVNNTMCLLTSHSSAKKATVRDWLPLIAFGSMVGLVVLGFLEIAFAAISTAIVSLIVSRTTFDEVKDSIKWDVLFVVGGAFGIAEAMNKTGAAEYLATQLFLIVDPMTPLILLMIVYILTNVLTEMITNNAAAVIVFPIMMSMVQEMSLNPEPYAVAIAIAASASFSTPIGYQTNLLVYSSGQYRFLDFMKIGFPLNVICFVVTSLTVPLFWPLS
ncbi:SLC13 family permease [Pseudalkalibacillus decolorationis]|uniref:SLC13 family permease n=1 Tax=Pseudalkalibacillus decolorationis TaxID=163879 RepID=UPI002148C64D|nr:SLC13 family permease [Pseudalkalibacillus decolorationis]